MGNSDIRKLSEIIKTDYKHIEGSTVAVDAHNWLYKYITVTVKWNDKSLYTSIDGLTEVPNVIGLLHGLPKFFKNDMMPIFVFDGTYHSLKQDEIKKRKQKRKDTAKRANKERTNGNIAEARRLKSQSQYLTPIMIESTKNILSMLDIPFITAPSAGESQAAYMTKNEDVDYALSSDYDTLLFGSNMTLRNFTGKGKPELMGFLQTLEKHDITHSQLIDIAILCGTDYNDGIYGVGPVKALNIINDYPSLEKYFKQTNTTQPDIESLRELYLKPEITDRWVAPDNIYPSYDSVQKYIEDEIQLKNEDIPSKIKHLKNCIN